MEINGVLAEGFEKWAANVGLCRKHGAGIGNTTSGILLPGSIKTIQTTSEQSTRKRSTITTIIYKSGGTNASPAAFP